MLTPPSLGIIDGQHRALAMSGILRESMDQDFNVAGASPPATCLRPPGICALFTAHCLSQRTDFMSAFAVEVHSVEDASEVNRLFLELNKSETVQVDEAALSSCVASVPVPHPSPDRAQRLQEIDLPNRIAPAKKVTIDGACNLLLEKYPAMFSKSQRCR
jgi:hypothetical protein